MSNMNVIFNRYRVIWCYWKRGKLPERGKLGIETATPEVQLVSITIMVLTTCDILCNLKKYPKQITSHDDVIKWKYFPRYWPFGREIHWSPVDSPNKGQWRGALMFSLMCARTNGWAHNQDTGDFRRHGDHFDTIIIWFRSILLLSGKGIIWAIVEHKLWIFISIEIIRVSNVKINACMWLYI